MISAICLFLQEIKYIIVYIFICKMHSYPLPYAIFTNILATTMLMALKCSFNWFEFVPSPLNKVLPFAFYLKNINLGEMNSDKSFILLPYVKF